MALAYPLRKDAKLTVTKANTDRADYSSADGLANAIICISVMLACMIAVIFLATR
jgi:hypothetical protein